MEEASVSTVLALHTFPVLDGSLPLTPRTAGCGGAQLETQCGGGNRQFGDSLVRQCGITGEFQTSEISCLKNPKRTVPPKE